MTGKPKSVAFPNPVKGIDPGSSPALLGNDSLIDAVNLSSVALGRVSQVGSVAEFPTNNDGKVVADYTSGSITFSVTNGSASVTASGSIAAGIFGGECLAIAIGGGTTYYKIISVESSTAFTLDRGWEGSTGTVPAADWTVSYPVVACKAHIDSFGTTQYFAACKNAIWRWNSSTEAWDSEVTLNHYNKPGTFSSTERRIFFSNGFDGVVHARTGDGDWTDLDLPYIESGAGLPYVDDVTCGLQLSNGFILIGGRYDTPIGYDTCYIYLSKDGGLSWASVYSEITASGDTWPRQMIQTSDGIVYVALDRDAADGTTGSIGNIVLQSNTNGESWVTQNISGLSGIQAERGATGIAEMSDGSIVVLCKGNDPAVDNAFCAFRAGHAGNFTAGTTCSLASKNPRSLLNYFNGTFDRLAFVTADGYMRYTTTTSTPDTSSTWGAASFIGGNCDLCYFHLMSNDVPAIVYEKGIATPIDLDSNQMLKQWKTVYIENQCDVDLLRSYGDMPGGGAAAWSRVSEGAEYILCTRSVSGADRAVLLVSYDYGVTWSQLWQENTYDLTGGFRFACHIETNRLCGISSQDGHLYYKYTAIIPRARSLRFWRSRAILYGNLIDPEVPHGVTPDTSASHTLVYNGQHWEVNSLVGARLYPDASDLSWFTVITANWHNTIVVADDITGKTSATTPFLIAWAAPERVRYSELFDYDVWDAFSYWDEDSDVMSIIDRLNADFETPQSGIEVFCKSTYSIILGTGPANWNRYSGGTERGCIAWNGAGEYVSLAHDGIAPIESTGRPSSIGGRLDLSPAIGGPLSFIERLNTTNSNAIIEESIVFTWEASDYLCVPMSGSGFNNAIFQFDSIRSGIWKHDVALWNTLVMITSADVVQRDRAIMIGTHDGWVRQILSSDSPSSMEVSLIVPLKLSDPMSVWQLHKIVIVVYVESANTLLYRMKGDYQSWSDWESMSLNAGINIKMISGGQQDEGHIVFFEAKIAGAGKKEFLFPIEFSRTLKHEELQGG